MIFLEMYTQYISESEVRMMRSKRADRRGREEEDDGIIILYVMFNICFRLLNTYTGAAATGRMTPPRTQNAREK